MNAYERLHAMVEGKEVDRPGASAWHHFNLEDRNIHDNVKRHIAFQETNNWDLIKIMPNGIYVQEQFGADITWSRNATEFPITNKRVINSPRGFRSLKPVSLESGAVAREVEVAKRLVEKYHGKVPLVATVFTPLTYAQELYSGWQNPWPFADLMRDYRDDLKEGLKVLTDVTREIIQKYVDAGVDGIFYAGQLMNDQLLTPEIYEELGVPYDLEAFKPAEKCWFNVLHVHGLGRLLMEFAPQYPVQAVNWEDLMCTTSLADGAKMMPDRIMMGGVEKINDFWENDREKLLEKMINRLKVACDAVPKNKLIFATGCAVDPSVPEYRLNTIKEAMDIVFGPDHD